MFCESPYSIKIVTSRHKFWSASESGSRARLLATPLFLSFLFSEPLLDDFRPVKPLFMQFGVCAQRLARDAELFGRIVETAKGFPELLFFEAVHFHSIKIEPSRYE